MMKFREIIYGCFWTIASFAAGFWWIVMSVYLLPEIMERFNPSFLVSLFLTLGIAMGAIIIAYVGAVHVFEIFKKK